MCSRKNKTALAMFLSVVYFLVSCFGSLSFAISSNTETNVSEGVYYFENQHHGLYISDLDYYSVILSSFSGQTQQRWELEYDSSGYYRIKNAYTGKYLTAPSNSLEGSVVEQSSKFAETQVQDRQLWSFVSVVVDGFEMIRIQAKSQEGSGMYLATASTMDSYGYGLIQTSNSLEYKDMWLLYPVKTAQLIAMDFNEAGHDHSSALNIMNSNLLDLGYDSNITITSEIPIDTVKTYLQNNNFIAIRSHGYVDDNRGCYMNLGGTATNYLYADDIYSSVTNTGLDMSKCEVALFIGCQTANHTTKSLPKVAVEAGADFAVGFESDIYCDEAELWTREFANYYFSGYDPCDAAELAMLTCASESINSMVVELQGG